MRMFRERGCVQKFMLFVTIAICPPGACSAPCVVSARVRYTLHNTGGRGGVGHLICVAVSLDLRTSVHAYEMKKEFP